MPSVSIGNGTVASIELPNHDGLAELIAHTGRAGMFGPGHRFGDGLSNLAKIQGVVMARHR